MQDTIQNFIDAIDVGILILQDNVIKEVNKAYAEMVGYSQEEIINWPQGEYYKTIIKEDHDLVLNKFKAMEQEVEGKKSNFFYRALTKSNEVKEISAIVKIIDYEGKKAGLISAIDITEKKQLENVLKETNELLNITIRNINMGLWDWQIKSGDVFYDHFNYNMLGYEKGDSLPNIDAWKNMIHPDDLPQALELLNAHIEGLTPYYEATYRIKAKSGQWIWILDKGSVVKRDNLGNAIRAIGTHQDITKLKEMELELRERAKNLEEMTNILSSSLKEKEILIKEIHHRVKNNLQILSAITSMHEQNVESEKDKKIFKDFQNRIRAMAKVHETLYRSDDLEKIHLHQYIKGIIDNLLMSYELETNRIKITTNIEDIQIKLGKAMHFGLIINELISNAFKHAFPHNREGAINVVLKRISDDKIQLTVEDNGIGMNPKKIDKHSASIGLKIIQTSTKQLKGEYQLNIDKGVHWTITFDKKYLI